jgi:poly-gamma-glutamate capsule biosynthesis protein CapA/YwtB (metallophosphatase superfamily)
MNLRHAFGLALAAAALGGCDHPAPCVDDPAPVDRLAIAVHVTDESGAGVPGANIAVGSRSISASASGDASFDLEGPAVLVVTAPGMLPEPVPVGWTDAGAPVKVRLLSDAGGARVVIHSGGDVMLGRRYEQPTSGEPLIRAASASADAARVLAALKPAFSSADVRTVNLETVLGTQAPEARYPGKRFILLSRPETLAAIKGIGVDVASLANNHARDYMDSGIAGTKQALAAVGLPVVGATDVDEAPDQPAIVEVRGTKVGVVAYTTVNGSVVNDQYPLEAVAMPPGTPQKEAWLYQERLWGYSDGTTMVSSLERRVGTAWQIFQGAEPAIDQAAVPPFFTSLTKTYPEVQDWVARRGHGGAALWNTKQSEARIKELAAKSDIVVVQLHAGFQFQEASSDVVHQIAHAAIDAGAHLVICHHPHVLQGLEIYKGRLIAYSLGNFVFDQDFLATFGSMFLRTVWEKDTLVEARVVPIELDAYRPLPVTGSAAAGTVLRLWERSVLPIQARTDADSKVRAHDHVPQADAVPAQLVLEGNTARVVADPPAATPIALQVAAGATAHIDFLGLVDARLGQAPGAVTGIEIGRDLFGWGRFEDETGDERADGDTHWALDSCQKRVVFGDAASGRGFLRMRRDKRWSVLTRAVARIPVPAHRAYEASSNTPIDPAPSYSFQAMARLDGDSMVNARFDVYHFDDTNPTEDPDSTLVRSVEIRLPLTSGGGWEPIDLALPPETFGGTPAPNMVLLYLSVDPPRATGETTLDVDDLAFVEWREASMMPAWFAAYDRVRNAGAAAVSLSFSGLPARR